MPLNDEEIQLAILKQVVIVALRKNGIQCWLPATPELEKEVKGVG